MTAYPATGRIIWQEGRSHRGYESFGWNLCQCWCVMFSIANVHLPRSLLPIFLTCCIIWGTAVSNALKANIPPFSTAILSRNRPFFSRREPLCIDPLLVECMTYDLFLMAGTRSRLWCPAPLSFCSYLILTLPNQCTFILTSPSFHSNRMRSQEGIASHAYM